MKMRFAILPLVLALVVIAAAQSPAQDASPVAEIRPFRLTRAVVCETIEDYEPKYVAVVFSINIGKISCYTSFDGVSDTTYIEHKWFHREELVTSKRLTIKPPVWSTYSSIQLREADKGPWRVEIWDAQDQLIKTLRFSVVD